MGLFGYRLNTADTPNADTLFPRFNTRFRYSGRTALQARKAAEMQNREEPHIARTAERRSMVDKSKNKEGEYWVMVLGQECDLVQLPW